MPSETQTTPASRREATIRLLELLALTGFAVAQPILGFMSNAVEFLLFRQAGPMEIIALAAVIVLAPPLVLWALGLLASMASPSLGRTTHVATVAGLTVVSVVQLLRALASGVALAAATLLLAAILIGAYVAAPVARSWLRFAAVAPFVFAGLFLFASPVRALLRPDGATTPGTPREETAPVVMILFDELPLLSLLEHGEIDTRLYPNFAALAADGTFFRNATSVAARTVHSVPAILTGQLPSESVAPVNQHFPGNLFALLSASHRVHAFESVTALCPSDVCTENQWGRTPKRALITDAARIWVARVWPTSTLPAAVESWFRGGTITGPGGSLLPTDSTFLLDRAKEDQPVRFERFLASIDGSGTPFHFVHLVLPHGPYQFLPDGRRYPPQDLGMVSYEQRTPASWPALINRQRHILQAMYVDRLLGQALDRLKQVGLYDRAAIVVTTDHGISFMPGLELGTRNLRPENEHEVAWVPLIVKSPGQRTGEVRDDNVLGIDVAPTLADLAGVDIPWHVDGISLITGSREDERKPWFNQPGVEIELDVAASFGRLLRGALSDLLTTENGPPGAFTLRRYGDLVGLPVNGLLSTDVPTGTAHLDRPEALRAHVPEASVVPSLVTGHLELAAQESSPPEVAIALDGVIVSASELYEDAGRRYRFASMVPPHYFNQRIHTVEVFLLARERGMAVLRPVRAAG